MVMWSTCLTVAAFTLQRDADALCGELQQQGIESSVIDESVAVGYGESWMRVFQVQVPKKAFERAGRNLSAGGEPPRKPARFGLHVVFLMICIAFTFVAFERTFWAAIFTVGGVGVVAAGIMSARRGRASCNWPCVRGQIVRAYISDGGDGDYYSRISYRFQVAGCEYTSDNVAYAPKPRRVDHESQCEQILRFPAGLEVDVFYDPARPQSAVLERGARASYLLLGILIGLVFIAAGVACFAWMPRG